MRKALVIGVDRYDSHVIFNLRNAVRDANKLGDFFRKGLPVESRFDVTLLENPTSGEVLAELKRIQSVLDDESVFAFYFAGHGLHVPRGDYSLVCRDATEYLLDGATDCGAVSAQVVRSFGRDGRGKMFFCFDASRTSSRSNRGVPSATGTRDVHPVFSRPSSFPGPRFFLSSCGANEPCADDGSFVDALVAEMEATVAAGRDLILYDKFVSGIAKRLSAMGREQHPEFSGSPFVLAPASSR